MYPSRLLLSAVLLFSFGVLLAQNESPLIGVTTPAGSDVPAGSRLLLVQALEKGLLNAQDFRLLDRSRLEAVSQARAEVRHEDYLASDRESIAALGAEYLLVSTIQYRKVELNRFADNGIPGKSLTIRYRIRISLLNVATGDVDHSLTHNFSGEVRALLGESEMDTPEHIIITKAEQYAAAELERLIERFPLPRPAAERNEHQMQLVEVVRQTKRKVTDVLIANKGGSFEGSELDLYINETYEIEGETLIRPVVLGMARAPWREKDKAIMECTILFGETELKAALDAGQTVYAKPYSER